jgi:hypothetical protein
MLGEGGGGWGEDPHNCKYVLWPLGRLQCTDFGTEYLGSYTWNEWFDIIRKVAPSVMGTEKAAAFVKGFPQPSEKVKPRVTYDPSKCDRILGIKYRTKEEMVKGVLEQGVREGWL